MPKVAEIRAHGAARTGRDVLHRRRFGRRGGHHDSVGHRAVLLELAHRVRNGGSLLPDGYVDAGEILTLLVDDGVDRHRRLAGLAVPADLLALAAADRPP